ncbi:uncharacterized protein [Rhodnius prolixus]|uniref:Uncharacterized protein n=1 Tax=Rhodnius prolixus TaxID=13249 RepID=T1ID37_RHOPR
MGLAKYILIALVVLCSISRGVTLRELDKATLDYYRHEYKQATHHHPWYCCFGWILATSILLFYILREFYSIKEPSMSLMESIQFNHLKKTNCQETPIRFEEDLLIKTYRSKTELLNELASENYFPYFNFLNKIIDYIQCNSLYKDDSGILLSEINQSYNKKVKRIYSWDEDVPKK